MLRNAAGRPGIRKGGQPALTASTSPEAPARPGRAGPTACRRSRTPYGKLVTARRSSRTYAAAADRRARPGVPIEQVIAQLTTAQANHPGAQVRHGKGHRCEVWPAPTPPGSAAYQSPINEPWHRHMRRHRNAQLFSPARERAWRGGVRGAARRELRDRPARLIPHQRRYGAHGSGPHPAVRPARARTDVGVMDRRCAAAAVDRGLER